MKLHYALSIALLANFSLINAQGFVTLTDEDGQVVNGTVIHKPLTPGYDTDTVKVYALLNAGSQMDVNVRRYEIWSVAGTQNFFCWGVCYLPVAAGAQPTWDSQHWLSMNPGWNYSDFGAYYMPQGQTGTARFRYVWYKVADPNAADSSWVDIDFGGVVGIGEQPAELASFHVWPNPAVGGPMNVSYRLEGVEQGASLVVYNVLGERVRTIGLTGTEGIIALPTGGLGTGVYLINLERGARMLGTRRVVVSH